MYAFLFKLYTVSDDGTIISLVPFFILETRRISIKFGVWGTKLSEFHFASYRSKIIPTSLKLKCSIVIFPQTVHRTKSWCIT